MLDPYIPVQTGYLALPLDGPVGVSTGKQRSVADIQAIVERNRAAHLAHVATYSNLAEVYAAMQTCLAWDTVYDPEKERVISPVSRRWNIGWGGYVLFDWDTYFAAAMAALDNPDLAYANAPPRSLASTPNGVSCLTLAECATSKAATARSRPSARWSCVKSTA